MPKRTLIALAILPLACASDPASTSLVITGGSTQATTTTSSQATLTTLIVSGPTTPPTTPGTSSGFAVPFQISMADASIEIVHTVNDGWVTFQRGPAENLLFTTAGPTDPESWGRFLSEKEGLTITESVGEVGGVEARMFDLELVGEPITIANYNPTPEELTGWVISSDNDQRIYVLEVEDVTIAIVAEAPDAVFGPWLEIVENSLASLSWSSGG
jgi:hypothetical protein